MSGFTGSRSTKAALDQTPGEGGQRASPPVWLYDGLCAFCSRSVLFVLRHERDHLIRFVAIQSDEGRALAVRHGIDPDLPDTFLFVENGAVLGKSDGVAAVFAHLRSPWSLAAGLTVIPRPMRDWLYDRLARNRYRLMGKRVSCMAPPQDWRDRFVTPEAGQ
jgi:predicted DCC family thiol-disulfide oxidoreductase YuxK